MSPIFAALRPEPGNAATMRRLEALGLTAVSLPLFEIRALSWSPPYPGDFDALLLTSANAVRFGGPGLDAFRHLPVLAVGPRTAEIGRSRGFDVKTAGDADARALLAGDHGFTRLLHLGGRERSIEAGGVVTRAIAVYASEPLPLTALEIGALEGTIALLHSARAASRLAELADAHGLARSSVAIAAFSPAVASAAGSGWSWIATAAAPNDASLIDAARARLTG